MCCPLSQHLLSTHCVQVQGAWKLMASWEQSWQLRQLFCLPGESRTGGMGGGWLCCLEDIQGALIEKVTSELDIEVDIMLAGRRTKVFQARKAQWRCHNQKGHIWSPDLEGLRDAENWSLLPMSYPYPSPSAMYPRPCLIDLSILR